MGASLRETRTQADVNIYPVIQEMRDAVTGVFSSLKRLLEDYFHVPESRMRSSRQRGDQKRLRDNRDRTPCSPMPALLGERWNCQIAVRPPRARPAHLAETVDLVYAQVCISLLQVCTS
jgi:hypothetical protein